MCNVLDSTKNLVKAGVTAAVNPVKGTKMSFAQAKTDWGAYTGKTAGKKAAKDVAAAEAERQGRISGNVADVNSAFDSREPQYSEFSDALRSRLGEGVDLQRQNAERQSRFALARGGLIGGSQQRDQSAELNREGREASIAAERQVQKSTSDMRSSDEDSRARMIALAQSGNDIGNAANQTANMLSANLGAAKGAGSVSDLGDLFANTAATYRSQQDAAARRRGLTEAQTYAKPFAGK